MIRFLVYNQDRPADRVDLTGAYLVGGDCVPVRSDLEFKDGAILCRKKTAGPAGLALLWPIDGVGRVLLETSRVPERDKPYLLQLELVRGRLMRISQKREDWSADEIPEFNGTSEEINKSRELLIDALKADSQLQAASLSQQALDLAVRAGDAISQHCADSGWLRRKQSGGFTRRVLGQAVDGKPPSDAYCKRLTAAADFVVLPFSWRLIEPAEQRFDWKVLDAWVEWLTKHRIPIRGSDLVCFSEHSLPDWIYIYEHDFEAIRDLIYEHVRRVISRYAPYVHGWDVVSGIHAHNNLSFSFEELLELTRMVTAVARNLAPRSPLSIDLCAPWGEYYARNQRTIPPHLYADMVLQSGIQFDAFGLRLHFGLPRDGFYVRDMFQVSSVIDRFNVGKPLHISAVGVPSTGKPGPDGAAGQGGGEWGGPWSEAQQARWVKEFYRLALAKSFVDTVTWRPFSDRDSYFLSNGGLLRADLSPKPAYEEILQIKASLGRGSARTTAKAT